MKKGARVERCQRLSWHPKFFGFCLLKRRRVFMQPVFGPDNPPSQPEPDHAIRTKCCPINFGNLKPNGAAFCVVTAATSRMRCASTFRLATFQTAHIAGSSIGSCDPARGFQHVVRKMGYRKPPNTIEKLTVSSVNCVNYVKSAGVGC